MGSRFLPEIYPLFTHFLPEIYPFFTHFLPENFPIFTLDFPVFMCYDYTAHFIGRTLRLFAPGGFFLPAQE